MKDSIKNKLENLAERLEEINHLLSSPEVINDQNKFRALSQEHAQLTPVISCFENYQSTVNDITEANRMLEDDDKDMQEMAKEELKEAKERLETLEDELQILMSGISKLVDLSSRLSYILLRAAVTSPYKIEKGYSILRKSFTKAKIQKLA